MGIEAELKFRIPARNLKALRRIPGAKFGPRSETDLVSTYFDTANHKLKRRGLTLRVRQNGKTNIQTIKSANGAQFGRDEWETEIKDSAPDLGKAKGTPVEPLATRKLRRKLKPVFETSVHRTTVPLRTRRSEIELAVDRGRITAGRRSSPIEEVELELKSGRPVDLFRIARALQRKSGAELDLRSKAERGYDLLRNSGHPVTAVEPIELKPGLTPGEVFRLIGRAAFRHFSANVDPVRNGDPEGIHQMRVGLRRLRTAISLFSKVLTGAGMESIKTELKWLTSELAPAREIDVFVTENVEPATHDALLHRGGKAIKKEFSARRKAAFARAAKAVNSQRYRSLLIDTLQWIEAKQTVATGDAGARIDEYADDLLRRRIKKARKDGRHLGEMSIPERHKFRIRIKKVRYAIEFLESLYPGKREQRRLARMSKHLKRIQDALGSLNDFAAHREIAVDAALNESRRNGRVRAFASGIVLGREDQAIKPLMKVATREARGLAAF
ncbi:CHAD domain-containing protein [Bradyrhizobium manausense]|uniref:CYTH and CHAD domain-containing protein n=1 Tax=Bradyrhizobium TaxID=374 RepID=UPI001BAE4CCF|nr:MULTISPECIES: CYTH and CHAD domain-containing protein [Bradyrhizobium]MBR0826061.1 CHAD domain-containing protein [Bradyrhizobium manausense]UVO31906.1 CHAD domain-containing protein [Bradyrhizobium arachidis]